MRSHRGSVFKWIVLFTGAVFGAASVVSGAHAASCHLSDPGANNLRLKALISEISADALSRMDAGVPAAQVRPQLQAALRLRTDLAQVWQRSPLLSIDRAPYFAALLESQYQSLYDQALAEEIKKQSDMSLEAIFDRLLDEAAKYQKLTKEQKKAYAQQSDQQKKIAETADALGKCLLGKSLLKPEDLKLPEQERSCKLDQSEKIKKPGKLKLAWGLISCKVPPLRWISGMSRCDYRKMIFNTAKPDLMAVREQIPAMVEAAFPTEFPKALIEGGKALEIQSSIPGLLNQKVAPDQALNPETALLWSSSLLDSNQESTSQQLSNVCLSEATLGQQADLKLASALKRARVAPSAAAPLLYGAVNRLFLIAGGNEVTLDPRATIPSQSQSTPLPTNQFGGWGYGSRVENAKPGYLTWDLDPGQDGFYNAAGLLTDRPVSPLRIFPSEITVGPRGEPIEVQINGQERPQVEKMSELLSLGQALVEHVDSTASDAPLGPHFASAEILKSDLLRADRPAAFPDQARSAAVGLLVAIVQNLSHPSLGHIEIQDVGVLFHENVELAGRVPGPLRSEVFAQTALWAASVQRSFDRGDAVYPKELIAYREKLDQLLGVASLTIAGLGVGPDGLIKPWIYEEPWLPNQPTLRSQISGLRAMGMSLARNESEPVRQSAVLALRALERFWVEGSAIPLAELKPSGSDASVSLLKPEDAWYAVNFWNDMKRVNLPQLLMSPLGESAPIDFALWNTRFEELRARLLNQL